MGMRDSPPVAAARRRLCASISSRIGVVAGAGDLGGHAQRGGHHLAVDHHQPQIVAGRALLDQHLGVLFAGPGQRGVQLLGSVDADGDALALLAAGGLDDDVADLVEERVVGSSKVASRPLGTAMPASETRRRVSRLSSQRPSPPRRCTPTTTLG